MTSSTGIVTVKAAPVSLAIAADMLEVICALVCGRYYNRRLDLPLYTHNAPFSNHLPCVYNSKLYGYYPQRISSFDNSKLSQEICLRFIRL